MTSGKRLTAAQMLLFSLATSYSMSASTGTYHPSISPDNTSTIQNNTEREGPPAPARPVAPDVNSTPDSRANRENPNVPPAAHAPLPGSEPPPLMLIDDISEPLPSSSVPADPDSGTAVLHSGLLHTAMIGSLVLFPPDNWPHGPEPRRSQFERSWRSAPTWHDGDPWFTNYVGHPIMGAYFFLFARLTGHSLLVSSLFSTANSLVWEYLIEAWFEQPSVPDLLVTSTSGTLIGEGMWRLR